MSGVYISGLPEELTEPEIKCIFREFGKIEKISISTISKIVIGHCVKIKFRTRGCADRCAKHWNNRQWENKKVILHAWLKRDFRKANKKIQKNQQQLMKNMSTSLIIKRFPDEWDKENLFGYFSKFGNIKYAYIEFRKAYVSFENEEQANNALNVGLSNEYNMIIKKWQRKNYSEEKKECPEKKNEINKKSKEENKEESKKENKE